MLSEIQRQYETQADFAAAFRYMETYKPVEPITTIVSKYSSTPEAAHQIEAVLTYLARQRTHDPAPTFDVDEYQKKATRREILSLFWDAEGFFQTLGHLKKVRELLTDPAHWCQGSFAKNQANRETGTHALESVSWCAIGAVRKTYTRQTQAQRLMLEVIQPAGYDSIADYNDSTSHAEVLAMIDKAITLCETLYTQFGISTDETFNDGI